MKNKLVYSNVRNRFEAATNVYDKKNWSLGMLNAIIYFPNCDIFITSTCKMNTVCSRSYALKAAMKEIKHFLTWII